MRAPLAAAFKAAQVPPRWWRDGRKDSLTRGSRRGILTANPSGTPRGRESSRGRAIFFPVCFDYPPRRVSRMLSLPAPVSRQEATMRIVVLIAALAAAMFFDLRASHAYEGPWCAVQSVGSGSVTENCRMATFEQCRMEVIAG